MTTLINTSVPSPAGNVPFHSPDTTYHTHLSEMQGVFTRLVQDEKNLFRVNASKLADEYVRAIPEASRQYYNCQTCRSFIKHYGSLAVISADGSHFSPIWDPTTALPEHAEAVALMASLVKKAPVVNVFMTTNALLGKPIVNDHHHLSLMLPPALVAKSHATLSLGHASPQSSKTTKAFTTSCCPTTRPGTSRLMRWKKPQGFSKQISCLAKPSSFPE